MTAGRTAVTSARGEGTMTVGEPERKGARKSRNERAYFKSGPVARLGFRLRTRFSSRHANRIRPGRFTSSRVQSALAAIGILTLVLGIFAYGSASDGLVAASALPILLLAGSLQLWHGHRYGLGSRLLRRRAGADDPVDTTRWHELLRWKLWRGSVGLVFGAEFALIADRWFAGHGQTAAAHTAGAVGWLLFVCSPIPSMLEPFLWWMSPTGWKRADRVDEAIAALKAEQLPMLVHFDPSRGAVGRPEPVFDLAAGAAGGHGRRIALNHSAHVVLEWDGRELTLFRPYGMRSSHVLELARPDDDPASSRRRRHLITELVWWENEYRYADFTRPGAARRIIARRDASLLFIDGQGYCRLKVRAPDCAHPAAAAVAEAAGLAFSVYLYTRPGGTLDEIERLLFPRRWNSKNVTW